MEVAGGAGASLRWERHPLLIPPGGAGRPCLLVPMRWRRGRSTRRAGTSPSGCAAALGAAGTMLVSDAREGSGDHLRFVRPNALRDPGTRGAFDVRRGADGLACRPGSVPGSLSVTGGRPSIYGGRCRHPSAIYPRARAGRPRTHARPGPEGSGLLDLAPGGVCLADPVTRVAGGLLHHRFTLAPPVRGRSGRSVLCGTVPRVTPGGCYPPPCPVEPGPSSAASLPVTREVRRRGRPASPSAPAA